MSDAGMQGAGGSERRRRTWSADQKQRIIADSFAPGASVAEVGRRYGLNSNMLFTGRQRERADVKDVGKTVNIVPVRVMEATPTATAIAVASMGRIEPRSSPSRGEISELTRLVHNAREIAIDRLRSEADQLGRRTSLA
jgi:transposase